MGPAEPPPPRSAEPGAGGTPPGEDPLDGLRERIRATQEAAARLVEEAAAARDRPPPQGYRGPPREGGNGRRDDTLELQALTAILELARSMVPRELQHQLVELVRELLLALRALIDWYLDRLDAHRAAPVEVEDIPID